MKDSLFKRQFFVSLVELGSIKLACREFELSHKEGLQIVFDLEREFGSHFIEKDREDLVLTNFGLKKFSAWRKPIQDLQRMLLPKKKTLSASEYGFLKISFPTTTGATLLSSLTSEFLLKHPLLRADIQLTHGSYHPMWNGTDLRVSHSIYQLEDVSQRPIGSVRRMMVCSPKYLESHGAVKEPTDLERAEVFGARDSVETGAVILKSEDESVSVRLRPQMIIRNHMASLTIALRGHGIALMVPRYLARSYIEEGKLVEVLPKWNVPSLFLNAIMALPEKRHPAINLLVDSFVDYFQRNEDPA